MVLYGPWQNKTVIRFVTDLTQKYVGWKSPCRARRKRLALHGLFHPTYFCVRSVTNLITNSIQLWIRPVLFSPNRVLKLIRQVLNSPIPQFSNILIYNSISPILNSPSGQRAKRAKIKRGEIFPVYSILKELPNATLLLCLWNIAVLRNNLFRCLFVCPPVCLSGSHICLMSSSRIFHRYVLQVTHAFLWMPPFCCVYLYLTRFPCIR